MTESGSRIEPRPMSEMRPEWYATLEKIPGAGLKGEGFPKNVLGAIMHNPATFGPFLEYWVISKLETSLSPREQELVILRVGFLYGSDYVWKHHAPLAEEFGVTAAEIAALKTETGPEKFSSRDQSLLEITDELVKARTIGERVWNTRARALTKPEVVDLISLVSQYVFFSLMNNAFRVPIEPAVARVPGLGGAA